ncbi:hypothetical protein J6590_032206 [Homalodisca vitripennis]|nr:hypothetical protein J6590_032206 [Homalodisca vitripennis]
MALPTGPVTPTYRPAAAAAATGRYARKVRAGSARHTEESAADWATRISISWARTTDRSAGTCCGTYTSGGVGRHLVSYGRIFNDSKSTIVIVLLKKPVLGSKRVINKESITSSLHSVSEPGRNRADILTCYRSGAAGRPETESVIITTCWRHIYGLPRHCQHGTIKYTGESTTLGAINKLTDLVTLNSPGSRV